MVAPRPGVRSSSRSVKRSHSRDCRKRRAKSAPFCLPFAIVQIVTISFARHLSRGCTGRAETNLKFEYNSRQSFIEAQQIVQRFPHENGVILPSQFGEVRAKRRWERKCCSRAACNPHRWICRRCRWSQSALPDCSAYSSLLTGCSSVTSAPWHGGARLT
jgi:hypothetical protein